MLVVKGKGYRILERNWRCPVGEIDIVARRGSMVVFVEVKTRRSLQLNRAVYAVPGNINSTYSFGSNSLIRQGAQPIMHVDDMLDFLGISGRKKKLQLPPLGSDERRLYNDLACGSEKTVDQLSQELSMGAGKINGIITVLEMKGLVYTALGKVFISM